MKTAFVFFVFILSSSYLLLGQDVKFSQYFASPLTVNPSLCGIYSGKFRVMGNYRNQWQEILYPYKTGTFSAESRLEISNLPDDILAIGFHALTDKSNNGGLRNNTFGGNISFHKSLDMEGISRIGIGLQAAYVSKIVDYSKMIFETQFSPIGYDISLPTNEFSNGFSMNYLDCTAGILYSYLSGDLNFYGGMSVAHITRPPETYGAFSTRLPLRLTFHLGSSFTVNNINTIYGSVMHFRTPQSTQTTMGLVYGINLNGLVDDEMNELQIGSWLRLNDAIVPYIGLKIGNVQGSLSYDITTSNVTKANKGMGGIEMSFQVLLDANKERSRLNKLKCKFMMY